MSPTTGAVHLDKKLHACRPTPASGQEREGTPCHCAKGKESDVSRATQIFSRYLLFSLHVGWLLGRTRVMAQSFGGGERSM